MILLAFIIILFSFSVLGAIGLGKASKYGEDGAEEVKKEMERNAGKE